MRLPSWTSTSSAVSEDKVMDTEVTKMTPSFLNVMIHKFWQRFCFLCHRPRSSLLMKYQVNTLQPTSNRLGISDTDTQIIYDFLFSHLKNTCVHPSTVNEQGTPIQTFNVIPTLIKLYMAETILSKKQPMSKMNANHKTFMDLSYMFQSKESTVIKNMDTSSISGEIFTENMFATTVDHKTKCFSKLSEQDNILEQHADCKKNKSVSCTDNTNFVVSKETKDCENFKAATCISPKSSQRFKTEANNCDTRPLKMPYESLQHVLFDRKKCTTKKGRPSSKKQKKRQREKIRHTEKVLSLSNQMSLDFDNAYVGISLCNNFVSSTSNDANVRVTTVSEPKALVTSNSFAAARLFILERNDSTEFLDSEDTDFSFSDKDNCFESYLDNSSPSCLSENEELLDMFAPCIYEISHITEPAVGKSICNESKSNINSFVSSFSFQPDDYSDSDDDSDWSDSDEITDSDNSKCFEINKMATDFFENDDFVVFSNKRKSLQEINATWESLYGSDGESLYVYDSGVYDSDGGVEDQSISKVHFADDPDLVTVHEVENLMTYFIDRERFKRRILQCEPTISSVLHQSHRQKMFKRNREMEALLYL